MGCEKSSLINNNFSSIYLHDQSNSANTLKDGQSPSPLKHLPAELSGKEIILIGNVIQKHILLYKLNQDQRMKLISSMQRFSVQQSNYIFKENQEPDYVYIISSGTVRIGLTKEQRQIQKVLMQGSIFGDLALINDSKRSASAFAITDCTLIALSKEIFHKKMEELSKDHQHLLFNFIDYTPAFKRLTNTQKSSLATHMLEVRYQKDSVIFQLGDFTTSLYLIKGGEIEVSVPNRSSIVLKKGDIFGDGSLKPHSIRSGQAKALTNAHCYVISRTKLSLCIQNEDIGYIIFHCIISWSLRRTDKYSKTSKALVQKIIDSGEIVVVEDGTVLATAGQSLAKMMICLEGEVTVQDIYKTLTKESQQIFSIGCIFNQDYQSPMKNPYTITKKSKGRLFSIQHKVLKTIFHPIHHSAPISIQPSQSQISLKDFQLIKHLQNTSYTSKYLVMDKKKQSYIIHAFNKMQLIQYKRQRLLVNDKRLNQSIKNSFVIDLERTLKDQSHVYFIYREYLNFTLDSLIKRVNFPTHQTIDFITMALINFLQFIHKQLIIFRDLKPDNIILDKNGYPHFISFMLAKKMSEYNYKTYTIIGTPHYLAPEVQQGMGYSFPSDYWSLGVIIYEMAIGYLPFADDKEDPYEIFIATQKQKLVFPRSFTNKRMKKLIKLLLCKQSWNRPDHTNIKTCGYFDEMKRQNWSQLDQGLTKCPKQIEELINEFSNQLAQEVLHETQGSFMAIFERQKLRYNNRCSAALDCSWDEEL